MAKKKIVLIAFSAIASFGVLANNVSHTSAPAVYENVAVNEIPLVSAEDLVEAVPAEIPKLASAPVISPAAAAPVVQTVAAVPAAQTVSAPDLAEGPALPGTSDVAVNEQVFQAVPFVEQNVSEADGIVAIGGQVLQSVWVDVPKLVFQNAGLSGAAPERPAMVSETIELPPSVSDSDSDAYRHSLKTELARPSTNFVYRDEKLALTAVSRSLSPSRSVASVHSASEFLVGANAVDIDRVIATLPVNAEKTHFETSGRNFTDDSFAGVRENANLGLLQSDIPYETVASVNTPIVEPVVADRPHFDPQAVPRLGLGDTPQPVERNIVSALLSSNAVSFVPLRSLDADRPHGSSALYVRAAGLYASVDFTRSGSVLAPAAADAVANSSAHSVYAVAVEPRFPALSAFVRDDSPSLLTSSIAVPVTASNAGFSIPEFAVAANISSHGISDGRIAASGASFTGDEIVGGLNTFGVSDLDERSHEAANFRAPLTPLFAAEDRSAELYFEPAVSASASRHFGSTDSRSAVMTRDRRAELFAQQTDRSFITTASASAASHFDSSPSLSGVFIDNATAALFVPETDKAFATVAERALAAPAKNAVSENKSVSTVPRTPVLIDGKVAMSHAAIAPMTGPVLAQSTTVDDTPAFTGVIRGGPSADLLASANDNSTPRSLTPATAAASPVLIGGRTEFSSDLLKPMDTKYSAVSPPAVTSKTVVGAPAKTSAVQQVQGYCDAGFVGDPIRFSQTVELRLEDLLSQLHSRFGVNFIMSPSVGKVPLNVKAGSIPWNVLLRSQLFISGIRARCIDTNTIELVENSKLPSLQDSAAVTTRFVKLKYLQRTSGGTVDSANRLQGTTQGGGGCGGSTAGSSSGGGSFGGGGGFGGGGQGGEQAGQQASSRFDRLVEEIEKVLGLRSMQSSSGGNNSVASETEEMRANRSVTQIPGRNILVITATEEEHQVVDQIIALADRPPFQVLVKGLIYGANQDRLLDLGTQTTITGGNAVGDIFGGISGTPVNQGGTLFDFSAVVGTFQFSTQFSALEQKGVLTVKSRPFTTVIDGLCTMLNVGKELPIVIDSGEFGGGGDVVFVNAANNLAITPYVIDDENGNPVAVTLELRLEANDVDSSITTRGVPAISKRSVQTQLLLGKDKTAILGGFTVDQDSKTVIKTPGLGDIPIIGELFKRRVRDTRISRLYFAITATVISYPDAINPVAVPGADTDIRNITPDMEKRANEAEKTPAKKSKDN